MSYLSFQSPSKILAGLDSIAKGVEYIRTFGDRVFVLAEATIRNSHSYHALCNLLERSGCNLIKFEDLETGTSIDTLHSILLKAKTGRPNSLVSVGGTRTHALSRTISILANSKVSLERFFAGETPTEQPIPLIDICSSGRDPFVSLNQIILHEGFIGRPLVIHHEVNPVRATVMDPKFHAEIPSKQAALFLFDQLLVISDILASQYANPISDSTAQSASAIAAHALRNILNNPKDLKISIEACSAGALQSVAMASVQPGLGFSIQLAIASRYGVAKSLVASIILPYIIELYGSYRSSHFIAFANAMGIDTESNDPERAPMLAAQALRRVSAKLNFPSRLGDLRISSDKAAEIASVVMELPFVRTAPFAVTLNHVLDLIRKAL